MVTNFYNYESGRTMITPFDFRIVVHVLQLLIRISRLQVTLL